MEGAGPTPSPTRWCSLADTLTRFLPGGEVGLLGRTHQCLVLCQAARGRRSGSGGVSALLYKGEGAGSEVGLHSTGVCLPFFLSVRLLSIILALFCHHVTVTTTTTTTGGEPLAKTQMIHLVVNHSPLRTRYLCTKMLFHLSLVFFLYQDTFKMHRVASAFEVVRFMVFFSSYEMVVVEEEIISQHCARMLFYCMHNPQLE